MSTSPSPSSAPAPRAIVALSITLFALATACGGGDAGTPPAASPPPLPPPTGCVTPADCATDNACTVATCTAGACGGTYTASTAAVLLGAGLAGVETGAFAVAPTSGSVIPRTDHTFCEGGPDAAADPPSCIGQLDLPAATGATFTPSANGGTLEAVVPFRFPRLVTRVFQSSGTIGSGSVAIAANLACPGAAQAYAMVPVRVTFTIAADGALDVIPDADAATIAFATAGCISGNLADRVAALVAAAGRDLIRARLLAALERALEAQLCAGPPCPAGFGEVTGLCRKGGVASGGCLARPRDPKTQLLAPAACVP